MYRIGIYSSNLAFTYTNFPINAAKSNSDHNNQSLVQTLQAGVKNYNFDSFELLMDSSYREYVIENPGAIQFGYSAYFGNTLTTEVSLSYYEKGREEILKCFDDDDELLNAHLAAFDNAFLMNLQTLAFNTSMSLVGEKMLARQYAQEGVEFEANKLATHNDFNGTTFYENAKNVLKEFGQTFLNNIKNGLCYTEAKKSAFEYMEKTFKTTSVNSLSLSDLMAVEKTWFAESLVEGRTANIAQRSTLNKKFNNSTELSAELRALLG